METNQFLIINVLDKAETLMNYNLDSEVAFGT